MTPQAPEAQRDDQAQAQVDQGPGDQVGPDLAASPGPGSSPACRAAGGPGEEPDHLGGEHVALDQQEDHQDQDDERPGHPDREVGQAVAQLLDQEGAVGVAQPVDRAGLGEEHAEVGLVADQVGDPGADLAGQPLDVARQRVGGLNRLSAVRLAT